MLETFTHVTIVRENVSAKPAAGRQLRDVLVRSRRRRGATAGRAAAGGGRRVCKHGRWTREKVTVTSRPAAARAHRATTPLLKSFLRFIKSYICCPTAGRGLSLLQAAYTCQLL